MSVEQQICRDKVEKKLLAYAPPPSSGLPKGNNGKNISPPAAGTESKKEHGLQKQCSYGLCVKTLYSFLRFRAKGHNFPFPQNSLKRLCRHSGEKVFFL